MPGTEPPSAERLRRLSTSSSEASAQDLAARQLLQDNIEYIPTRLPKVPAPRPATNPLQFIKVGPCDLYKSAQEQLKKVEAVKKLKQEVREEQEDWQSNLDNWKSSRRKRQEHIIERVVEVKRFEDESVERNQPRRRNKTFGEMMEERRGGGGHVHVVYSQDDDGNDLSDLGLGSDSQCSTPSTPTPPKINNSHQEIKPNEGTIEENQNNFCIEGTNGNSNGHGENNGHSTPNISPEPDEEYTYERAIQSYVNFAENQVKKLSKSAKQPPVPPAKPKRDSFINELNGNSESDLNKKNSSVVSLVPKGDILKRREIFEKAAEMGSLASIGETGNEIEDNNGYRQERRLSELTNTKSIKERLWNLTDNSKVVEGNSLTSPTTSVKVEVTASVKDRLTNLQRHVQGQNVENSPTNSNPKLDITQSVRERLNNLERNAHQEPGRQVTPDRDPAFLAKLANFMKDDERASSPEEAIYATKRTQLHRSMDSLGSSPLPADTPNSAFERVQSLEDLLDCRSSLPSSDREDSGIHTADVSCAVSQADEESGGDPLDLATDLGPHKRQGSELSEQLSPLPPIEETPIEPTDFRVPSNPDSKISSMKSPDLESGRNTPMETDETVVKPNDSAAILALDALIAPAYNHEKLNEDFINLQSAEVTNTDISINNHDVLQLLQSDQPKQFTPSDDHSIEFNVTEKNETLIELIDTPKPPVLDKEIILDLSNTTIELAPLNDLAELEFPLRGLSSAEPPKEKPPPPPPPVEKEGILPNEDSLEQLPMKISLRRLDSTKRIKKELRRKRSDFLGIADDQADDLFLEPALQLAPPPDMAEFLAEERRTEQQLYRQSICSSELDDSLPAEECQDSGVELERPMSAQHSAQNSEIYGNDASITSEEEELIKKEREIIERLEKEEEYRNQTEIKHENNKHPISSAICDEDVSSLTLNGEKEVLNETNPSSNDLAEKLRKALEEQKQALDWARAEEDRRRNEEEIQRNEEEQRLRAKEIQLQQQENKASDKNSTSQEDHMKQLREERERLQREQEELQRQKEEIRLQEELQRQKEEMRILEERHERQKQEQAAAFRNTSLEEETAPPLPPAPTNYRLSLPDLQDEQSSNNNHNHGMLLNTRQRPPPPIPPARPLRSLASDHPIRNSRMPSADSIPHQVEAQHLQLGSVPAHLNQQAAPPPQHQHSTQPQQMTRQTLQALSAAPRLRIADSWVQPKRKPADQVHRHSTGGSNYNYQHWLIQEAEHRRIHEQHQRQWPPAQQQQQQQTSQPPIKRSDKPLPDSIIHTLTQRVQNRTGINDHKRRSESSPIRETPPLSSASSTTSSSPSTTSNSYPHHRQQAQVNAMQQSNSPNNTLINNNSINSGNDSQQEKMLSVSGKKKCSHCNEELGRGAAMIIESLRLFYHIDCFKCCVCHVQLGDGLMGTDVRVRNNKLHCHNCYSSDDGIKFSCV